jgi:GH24 family phage-related lysozyme (muramidase)
MMYLGVVEERCSDEYKSGRCRVRVAGVHTEDKTVLPTVDLPWAYPKGSIRSAGMSGIGESPTGLLEGSWVFIEFLDEYQQMPIITGSWSGVPSTGSTPGTSSTVVTDSSGNPVTDSSGNPVTTETDTPTTPSELQGPGSMDISSAGIEFIKSEEKISSLVKGKNSFSTGKGLAGNTRIYSYQDSKGVWTIGWGNTYLKDNSRVSSSTELSKDECDALFVEKLKEYVSGVKRNLKILVTQQMFDALCSMAYNMGVGGLTSSSMFSSLNAGKYAEASALIPSTRANGLANRRSAEKNLFDSGGYPNSDGTVSDTPAKKVQDAGSTGSTGTGSTGTTTTTSSSGEGFKDPYGKYPLYLNEPDTHRLARGESISKTIIKSKIAKRETGVKSASGTWSQPPIPFRPEYPYNHTRVSESGHIEEIDDTKGSERLHRYHKSGTYDEIDVNGTWVKRIVGDSYEILERNGNILIKGTCNITVVGNSNIRIENDCNLQVLGNMKTTVSGNYDLQVGGKMNIGVAGKVDLKSGAEVHLDGEKIHLNSGGGGVLPGKLDAASGVPEMGPLFAPSVRDMLDANYETPEEGDNTEFKEKHKDQYSEEELAPTETKADDEKATPEDKPAVALNTNCESLKDSDITSSYKLSTLFTLGDVLKGSSGIPKGTNYGLTASEIVCNLKGLAIHCLEPIKSKYPNMVITNTWRSEKVNNSVGGSKTSDHLTGSAADIQLSGFNRKQHFDAIVDIQKILPAFKQLIFEVKGTSTWIHISFKEGSNKNECLTIDAARNKTLSRGSFVLPS